MKTIVINPGHGGSDPGAMGNGLQEKNLTLAIVKEMESELSTYDGVKIYLTRGDDKTMSLQQITDYANKLNADLLVVVHINAGGGQGFESFVYNQTPPSTTAIQNMIHAEVLKATGFKDRGKKRENFHVLRESKMDAVLTENGFIDNLSDSANLKRSDFIQKIASGHVQGIVKFYGLKKKVVPVPTPPPATNKLYKVQVGAFSVKKNAESLAKELEGKGYKTYVVQS